MSFSIQWGDVEVPHFVRVNVVVQSAAQYKRDDVASRSGSYGGNGWGTTWRRGGRGRGAERVEVVVPVDVAVRVMSVGVGRVLFGCCVAVDKFRGGGGGGEGAGIGIAHVV